MLYGIFSDIHAHLGRLNVVLDYLKTIKVDHYICLGDIVGYGTRPNECVELIRKLNCPTLMGNHDHVACGLGDASFFNTTARQAILWTQTQLTPENKEYLKSLPYTYNTKSFLAVHASPQSPEKWEYVITMESALMCFQYFQEQICFIGHSHIPFFCEMDRNGNIDLLRTNPMVIKYKLKYLVNVGSVGQPRDNNPNTAFAIYDDKDKTVTLKRLPYDGPEESLPPSPPTAGITSPLSPNPKIGNAPNYGDN